MRQASFHKKKTIFKYNIILLTSILTMLFGSAQSRHATTDSILDDTTNTICGKLPNGFSYYLAKNPGQSDKITIKFIVKVGFMDENVNQLEFSHLLEHLALRKTKNLQNVKEYFHSKGLKLGGDVLGITSPEQTDYEITIPANDEDLLKKCLLLVRDWLLGEIVIDSTTVTPESGIVLQEIGWIQRSTFSLMNKEYVAKMLENSPDSWRINADSRNNIRHINLDSLRNYYSKWYQPTRASIIIAGNINVKDTKELVVKTFLTVNSSGETVAVRPNRSIQLNGQSRLIVVTHQNKKNIDLKIAYKSNFNTITKSRKNTLEFQILASLIQNRLQSILTNEDPTGVAVCKYLHPFGPYRSGLDALLIETGLTSFSEVPFYRIINSLYEIKRNGFSNDELINVKKYFLNRSTGQESNRNIINRFTSHFTENVSLYSSSSEVENGGHIISNITLEQVNRLASKAISNKNKDIVILAPKDSIEKIPSSKIINLWIKKASTTKSPHPNITKKTRKETISRAQTGTPPLLPLLSLGQQFDDNHYKYSFDTVKSINATETLLPNGIKVIIKPIDDSEKIARITVVQNKNTNKTTQFQRAITFAAGKIILESGMGNYNKDEMAGLIEANNIDLSYSIYDDHASIGASAKKENIDYLFQIIHSCITTPKIDSEIFSNWKQKQQAEQIVLSKMDPIQKFDQTVSRLLGNVNYYIINQDSLAKLQMNDLLKVYRETFSDCGPLTVIISGDVSSLAIEPLLKKYIQNIPARKRSLQSQFDSNLSTTRLEITYTTDESEVSQVAVLFPGLIELPQNAMFKATLLAKELETCILNSLRETHGLSYNPTVQIAFKKLGEFKCILLIHFDCAPGKVYDAIQCSQKEIINLQQEKYQSRYLPKVKALVLDEIIEMNKNPGFWSEYLTRMIVNCESLKNAAIIPENSDDITPTDMTKFVKQFDIQNYSLVVLDPNNISN